MGTESLTIYAQARSRARRSSTLRLLWRERRLVTRVRGRRACACELARLAAVRGELAARRGRREVRHQPEGARRWSWRAGA